MRQPPERGLRAFQEQRNSFSDWPSRHSDSSLVLSKTKHLRVRVSPICDVFRMADATSRYRASKNAIAKPGGRKEAQKQTNARSPIFAPAAPSCGYR